MKKLIKLFICMTMFFSVCLIKTNSVNAQTTIYDIQFNQRLYKGNSGNFEMAEGIPTTVFLSQSIHDDNGDYVSGKMYSFTENDVSVSKDGIVGYECQSINSGNSLAVTPLQLGQTTITIHTDDVDFQLNITVRALSESDVVVVSKNEDAFYSDQLMDNQIIGQKYQLKIAPKLNPSYAYDDNGTNWTSDNPSVASVTSDGQLETKSVGTAHISCQFRGLTVTKTIHVYSDYGITVNDYETDPDIYSKVEDYLVGDFIFPYITSEVVAAPYGGGGFMFVDLADESVVEPWSLSEWPWIAAKPTQQPVTYTLDFQMDFKTGVDENNNPIFEQKKLYSKEFAFNILEINKENVQKLIDKYYTQFKSLNQLTLSGNNGVLNIKNKIDNGQINFSLSYEYYQKLNEMLKYLGAVTYDIKGASVEGLDVAVPLDIQISSDVKTASSVNNVTVTFDAQQEVNEVSSKENENYANQNNYTVIDTKEMIVTKTDSDQNTTVINELNAPVQITIPFNDELAEDEEVIVLRNHNDKIDELEATVDQDQLTFSSDRFSTYTIVKRKIEDIVTTPGDNKPSQDKNESQGNQTSDNQKISTVKTGDDMNMVSYIAVMVISIAIYFGYRRKKA